MVPICAASVSRLKNGTTSGVKKWEPEIRRLAGFGLALEGRTMASKRLYWSAKLVRVERTAGCVDARHEALYKVATAPLATGMAVVLVVSQV